MRSGRPVWTQLDPPAGGLRTWRWVLSSTIAVAFFFVYYDLFVLHTGDKWLLPYNQFGVHYDAHYLAEAIVRAIMLVVALLTVWQTRGRLSDRLLAEALVGGSLDVYWEWYASGGPLLWFPLALRYLATAYALMQFIRFAATFGAESSRYCDYRGIRLFLYRYIAPTIFFLAVVGFLSWAIRLEILLAPGAWVTVHLIPRTPANLSAILFNTYLIGDASAKFSMIVAASVGWVMSPTWERPKLKWETITFCVYAAGTAIHFIGRVFSSQPDPEWAHWIDTVGTLALPIGLGALLVGKKRFFDVRFRIDRVLLAGVATAAAFVAYFIAHDEVGPFFEQVAKAFPTRASGFVPHIMPVLSVVVGLLAFYLTHVLYDSVLAPSIESYFFPQRERTLKRLQHFGSQVAKIKDIDELYRGLFKTIKAGAGAQFVHVFRIDNDTCKVMRSTELLLPPDVPVSDPSVRQMSEGAYARPDAENSLVPGALAVPMFIGGRLVGFIACGENKSQGAFTRPEIKELEIIARETCAALYALQQHRPAVLEAPASD